MIPITNGPPVELHPMLRAVSRPYAPLVCRYFRRYSTETADVDDLVRFVRDHDERATEPDRVDILLHHVTLPALAAAGALDYSSGDTVRYLRPDLVEPWLDNVSGDGGGRN
ncbi:hypothetical protein [Haloarcula onubensis]|uniref:Halobacterial output domain-containing protein n=1 Tax=Haloarcula onubensis TaxID=2950539 RepID=A0ABU2FR37_9EURY|nr:hypothetical protein [Halomicroarcula sp. S3CR25-11]MDS0283229.1 hypothetical protein [Halomicroarcula sp. S3CR25-11]